MNKVILMGRLVRDPEVRYSKSETPIVIARYRIAVKNNYSKNNMNDTMFIDVVSFGKKGEFASKYLTKGRVVIVEGKLQEDSWEDAEHIRHWKFEIIAEHQYFADGYSKRNDLEIQSDEEIAAGTTQVENMSINDLPF